MKKQPIGLIVLSSILAVVIAVSAVLYFVLPSSKSELTSVAQDYLIAAYYADRVASDPASYATLEDYRADLDTVIGACRALQESGSTSASVDFSLFPTAYASTGSLEGLDTDAGSDYSGGYTEDARDAVEEILDDMKDDAGQALEVLQDLDSAAEESADLADLEAAAAEAKNALSKVDRASIVVGSTKVSFAGVRLIGAVHTACLGLDIVIDGKTMYLGTDGVVMLSGDFLGDKVTVIDSKRGSGVVLDTRSMIAALDLGQMLALDFDDLGREPEAEVFTDQKEFSDYISEEITQGIGFNDTATTVPGSTSATDSDTATSSGSGVHMQNSDIVGNWAHTDYEINPFEIVDTTNPNLQEMLDAYRYHMKHELTLTEQESTCHWIFREDGTGISYWDVNGATMQATLIWWRDDGENIAIYWSGAAYDYEWESTGEYMFERFQSGDFSDYQPDSMLDRLRLSGEDLYEASDEDICRVYSKTTDSVAFTYKQLDMTQ